MIARVVALLFYNMSCDTHVISFIRDVIGLLFKIMEKELKIHFHDPF